MDFPNLLKNHLHWWWPSRHPTAVNAPDSLCGVRKEVLLLIGSESTAKQIRWPEGLLLQVLLTALLLRRWRLFHYTTKPAW